MAVNKNSENESYCILILWGTCVPTFIEIHPVVILVTSLSTLQHTELFCKNNLL